MSWFTKQAPPQQPQGMLGQLGQGSGYPEGFPNTPQPVPGGAVKFPGADQSTIPPIASAGRVVNGTEPMFPGGPTWDQWRQQNGAWMDNGNRGSGQPINQPMGSLAALGAGVGNLPSNDFMNPATLQRGAQGAAQIGAGLNQSGMVTLRSPDGLETKQMSQADAQHWLQKGAQIVQGAF